MKEGRITLAIDFDGTICEHEFPRIGEVKLGAVKAIQALDKAGFRIVIHTCRVNPELDVDGKRLKETEAWLKEQEIPYDEIWMGKGKPIASVYIGDTYIAFQNWAQVMAIITDALKPKKEEDNGKVS